MTARTLILSVLMALGGCAEPEQVDDHTPEEYAAECLATFDCIDVECAAEHDALVAAKEQQAICDEGCVGGSPDYAECDAACSAPRIAAEDAKRACAEVCVPVSMDEIDDAYNPCRAYFDSTYTWSDPPTDDPWPICAYVPTLHLAVGTGLNNAPEPEEWCAGWDFTVD